MTLGGDERTRFLVVSALMLPAMMSCAGEPVARERITLAAAHSESIAVDLTGIPIRTTQTA